MSEKKNSFEENKEAILALLAFIFDVTFDEPKGNVPMFPYASNDYLAGKVDAYEKLLFREER